MIRLAPGKEASPKSEYRNGAVIQAKKAAHSGLRLAVTPCERTGIEIYLFPAQKS